MSPEKKRKLDEYAADLLHSSSPHTTKLEEKAEKLSESGQQAVPDLTNGSIPAQNAAQALEVSIKPGNNETDSNQSEWTVVDRKGKKRKKAGDHSNRIKYPELAVNGQLQKPIKLGELQNLILYTLADGVGPNWVAFKYSGHTKKVVCLMVPGLEMSMFDGSSQIEHLQEDPNGPTPNNESIEASDQSSGGKASEAASVLPGTPVRINETSLGEHLRPLAAIFDQVWPVKAPGDTKYSRLHSPIQALLISSLPQSQEEKKMKGPRPPKESQSFQATRTPVTEFLLSPDDLREAEYPMHPASCETEEDLATEQERRQNLSQTVADGWVDTYTTPDSVTLSTVASDLTGGRQVLAVDCEMVVTIDDRQSLARISVIDWSGKTILDELVKPSLPIKNYFTEFSGITPELLESVTTTLQDIQLKLLSLITPSTILMGHSLESDLSALRMTHPHIIDTSLLYPHPRGPPLRSSLKFLTQKYLRREIQRGGAKGHDSVEDALAVLDLVKLKCEKGLKWGTSEMNGETIFRRLSRAKDRQGTPRTTAIVDHGIPERGYGKDATHAIGCKSDAEIVEGVKRAVNGDPDGRVIPAGGVDFTWARLRELESLRGWSNNNRSYSTPDSLHKTANNGQDTSNSTLTSALTNTIAHILSIYASLPPTTLFMLYSGTGDPREVGRLQALQRQFKREYQTKKWDELSVQWTDAEEQGLRKAVEQARLGVGFFAVK